MQDSRFRDFAWTAADPASQCWPGAEGLLLEAPVKPSCSGTFMAMLQLSLLPKVRIARYPPPPAPGENIMKKNSP